MKTVFMIAPYFVPRRRVGSLRPYKFVAHLREFGWEPIVCTIEEKNCRKTSGEKKVLEGIEILSITPPFDRTDNSQGKIDRKDSVRGIYKAGEMVANWFDQQVPMDSWIFLFWSSYSKILTRAKEADPDIIWSTGDPWSGHWVGKKLAHDLSKPWIADFRDPWTLSRLNLRKRSWFSSWADQILEKKIVVSADKLVFTSRSTEESYKSYYGLKQDKTDTIYNSFHLSDIHETSVREWKADLNDTFFNIIFFGSFRRLSPVLPIAKSIAKIDQELQSKLRIHSFDSLDQSDKEVLEKLGISKLFITHKKVPPDQAQLVFQRADLLLVSTSRERKTIIPAKLWEYLKSDKPILSITPNPEIGEILDKSGAGVHFSNEQGREISRWLADAINNKLHHKPIIDLKHRHSAIECYSSRNTTRQFAQILDELTTHE